MANQCVICVCVYNNELGLPYCLKNIKKMKEVFHTLQVLCFYDVSNDRSLEILENFRKESGIPTLIVVNPEKQQAYKTYTIAFSRNYMIRILREWFSDWEFFVMMDTNNYACIGDIRLSTLESVLLKKDEWDAISFDREAGYYDTWALSFGPFVYSFFHFVDWQEVVEKMRNEFGVLLEDYKTNRPSELIPVFSAFNGFSLYKTAVFSNCSYSSDIDLTVFPPGSIDNQIQYIHKPTVSFMGMDCEHRKFHLEAIQKNNARIRISTQSLFSKCLDPPERLRGPA
jgi:hypothetical protein